MHDAAVKHLWKQGALRLKRQHLLIGVSMLAIITGGSALYIAPLAMGPVGAKDCTTVLPPLPPLPHHPANVAEPSWSQRGGHVNDASCLSRTPVAGVVRVKTEADVATALRYAAAHGLTVSAAGVRHSMGGRHSAPAAWYWICAE